MLVLQTLNFHEIFDLCLEIRLFCNEQKQVGREEIGTGVEHRTPFLPALFYICDEFRTR